MRNRTRGKSCSVGLVLLACTSPAAFAMDYCISSYQAWEDAVYAAAHSPEGDRLLLESMTIDVPFGLSYVADDPAGDFEVHGGYEPGCVGRTRGAKTVLRETGGTVSLLQIGPESGVRISVSAVVFLDHDGVRAALDISAPLGEIRIDASGFFLGKNHFQSAFTVFAVQGSIFIADTVVIGNESEAGVAQLGGASSPGTEAVTCYVSNLTFVDNVSSLNQGDAPFVVAGCENAVVANSIFWANEGSDLQLAAVDGSSQTLRANNIQTLDSDSATAVVDLGNLSVDPLLGGSLISLAPLAGSPMIDAGDASFVPTENTTNLLGEPRIIGAAIDIGAIEMNFRIMRDGFE